VKPRARLNLYYTLAIVWLLLTVSLASWWLVFGLGQARRLGEIGGPGAARLSQVQYMLASEGAVLIGLLIVGGVALVVGVRREQARQRAVEAFFMAFTHELRTAIAGVQLQAESLQEDLPEAASHPGLARLLRDSRRLQLQLENSLYFAQPDGRMLVEPVDLRACIANTAADWAELSCQVKGDARAMADVRALQSVLRNVLQNALVHGEASSVEAKLTHEPGGVVSVDLADNGRGASAEVFEALGRPFAQPSTKSGTGVGLFVSRQLMQRMRGDLRWHPTDPAGFAVTLYLPEAP